MVIGALLKQISYKYRRHCVFKQHLLVVRKDTCQVLNTTRDRSSTLFFLPCLYYCSNIGWLRLSVKVAGIPAGLEYKGKQVHFVLNHDIFGIRNVSFILYLVAPSTWNQHLDDVATPIAAWKSVSVNLAFFFFSRIWKVWLGIGHTIRAQSACSWIQHFLLMASNAELASCLSVVACQSCRLTWLFKNDSTPSERSHIIWFVTELPF